MANTPVIKQVTVPAATSVGLLAALGETIGTLIYTVMIYAPQSEYLNLSLADTAGIPSDPESTIPAQDNPYVIEATRDEVFLYNSGSVSVNVICRAHVRQAA